MTQGVSIHFALAVWGEAFVDLFCDLVLPNQVSGGNLAGLRRPQSHLYVIYTRKRDAERIVASPAYARLAALMAVEFRLMRTADDKDLTDTPADPYHVMSLCHEDALARASGAGAGCAFLVADAVLGEGSLVALEEKAASGASLILVAGLRSVLETFGPWLQEHARQPSGVIALAPRDGVTALGRTSADQLDSLFIGSDRFSHAWPSALAAPAGDDSLAVSLLHPHPIYVRLEGGVRVAVTIDHGSFVDQCIDAGGRVEGFASTDEFLLIEMSSRSKLEGLLGDRRPFDLARVQAFARSHVLGSGRRFASDPFVFRGRKASDTMIKQAKARLEATVRQVFAPAKDGVLRLSPLETPLGVDRDRRAYFYGAGDLGRDLAQAMDAGGDWCFGGFVDTFRRGEHGGRAVLNLSDLQARIQPEDQITITSSRLIEIAALLHEAGVESALDANPWRQAMARARCAQNLRFS